MKKQSAVQPAPQPASLMTFTENLWWARHYLDTPKVRPQETFTQETFTWQIYLALGHMLNALEQMQQPIEEPVKATADG